MMHPNCQLYNAGRFAQLPEIFPLPFLSVGTLPAGNDHAERGVFAGQIHLHYHFPWNEMRLDGGSHFSSCASWLPRGEFLSCLTAAAFRAFIWWAGDLLCSKELAYLGWHGPDSVRGKLRQ